MYLYTYIHIYISRTVSSDPSSEIAFSALNISIVTRTESEKLHIYIIYTYILYIHIYIYICVQVYIYIYIYIAYREQRSVLRNCVQCVEHFNRDQNRERECGGGVFPVAGHVVARLGREVEAAVRRPRREVGSVGVLWEQLREARALAPVYKKKEKERV